MNWRRRRRRRQRAGFGQKEQRKFNSLDDSDVRLLVHVVMLRTEALEGVHQRKEADLAPQVVDKRAVAPVAVAYLHKVRCGKERARERIIGSSMAGTHPCAQSCPMLNIRVIAKLASTWGAGQSGDCVDRRKPHIAS